MVSEEVKSTADLSTTPKAILDSKRRNDLVDEAFSEQKDILLDMVRVERFFYNSQIYGSFMFLR